MLRAGGDAALVAIARALDHRQRRLIFAHLERHGESSPLDVAEASGASLSNISYHVRVLHRAGVLRRTRRVQRRGAIQNFYVLDEDAVRYLEALRRVSPGSTPPSGEPADDWGTLLRERREKLDLQLDDVANVVGVTPSVLAMIEAGRAQPALQTLRKLAQLLGLQLRLEHHGGTDDAPGGV
ncbi:helix-turn-helix domain-containing protein [Conexibacter stalactiti]|uniref:Helix-turn-helix domain-containing protein n=1 Tax=Conexibacter stalactiti TaxID=1940611 RepID=A0ABU4HLM0_9ACTN|nr:helix-turn-helix domain-containing protein [Conexibacter stalactiti]MDW5593465.1 helix-turn-helix domain-containing protein [Conexibacter stalactiti]MEC5034106.1 helix-turn-helix domain-containing protein [Conexibacter stalactiti]